MKDVLFGDKIGLRMALKKNKQASKADLKRPVRSKQYPCLSEPRFQSTIKKNKVRLCLNSKTPIKTVKENPNYINIT